ncbi:MAG: aldo/keto reductase [Ignavibacteria bacterium]|jgi:aryl-alcohol dehydrogenase-like predicted oxidoreductase
MKYSYLGNSGLIVSTVCLGTMTFGQKDWGCDESASLEILNAYKERGGNFIDTADIYSETVSEQIIGKWLENQNRDEFVIATKCYYKTGNDINSKGLSRKHIISGCEASLKRLKTDYVDLYQIHGPDYGTPLEETLSALDTLVQQGKVRYIGCSNLPAWMITKSNYKSELKGYHKFISGQYLYNLLKRDVEIEVISAAKDAQMKLICWSPLSGGMLTGKYVNENKPPQNTRFELNKNVTDEKYQVWIQKSNQVISKVREIAELQNLSSTIISLAWLLKNEIIASVITGARSSKQIIENCKASDFIISDDDWNSLNEVSMISYGYPNEWYKTNSKGWFENIV